MIILRVRVRVRVIGGLPNHSIGFFCGNGRG
jgi:hypothetical protein